eukprot:gb/GEZN01005229.1/.p1 GENE.gb/GEZN01005229.1/~~gb/GEZN01005229.1/.p1  ORF type:complete len:566 (+),score=43.37 gb/GEZN01005229.1/:85-1782(+)
MSKAGAGGVAFLVRSLQPTSTASSHRHGPPQTSPGYGPMSPVGTQPEIYDLWLSVNCRLEQIDPVAQQFEVSGWMHFFWIDKKFPTRYGFEKVRGSFVEVEDDGEHLPINLNYIFENAAGPIEHKTQAIFRFDEETGLVSEKVHFSATLTEDLELDRFPFDRQYLTMRICIRSRFHVLGKPPPFVPDRVELQKIVSYRCSPTIAGWNAFSPVVSYCKAVGRDDIYRIAVSMRVEREPLYFLVNILVPVLMIVSLAPISFIITSDEIGSRMSIVLTLLLTVVTFKFVIFTEIPKTATTTMLDKYIMIANFVLLWAVGQSVLCFFCVADSFLPNFNRWCVVLTELGWIGFNVWIVRQAFSGNFRVPWEDISDFGADGEKPYTVNDEEVSLPTERTERKRQETRQQAARGSIADEVDLLSKLSQLVELYLSPIYLQEHFEEVVERLTLFSACMVLVGLGTRSFSNIVGFLHPFFESLGVAQAGSQRDRHFWMLYWVLFCGCNMAESISDGFHRPLWSRSPPDSLRSWCHFHQLKTLCFLWCFLPKNDQRYRSLLVVSLCWLVISRLTR